ncbi:MAG: hypothetical protein U9P50_00635 [Patescibacteria group bacterium]|nr:hypothetical protein [Patescibacteria group bacterium]
MKIFIISSKNFYEKIPEIKEQLEKNGNIISLPNCFDAPETEAKYRDLGKKEHSKWKSEMICHSVDVIKDNNAVLVLNLEKNGIKNYIGGATFLEMYDAFRLGKKIFLYNPVPEGMLYDEIIGFNPIVINQDLNLIK